MPVIIAIPIAVALVVACWTRHDKAPVSPTVLTLGVAGGLLVGTVPFLFYAGLFPEQPHQPGTLHSWMAAGIFYLALSAWMGGAIGIAAAIALVNRRAGGWYCLIVGAVLAVMSISNAVSYGGVPGLIQMPFWWRLFVAQESAPVFYISVVMIAVAAWFLGRGRKVGA
jgi:hypothetical protein